MYAMNTKYIHLIVVIVLLSCFTTASAQPDLWDVPTTEALIAHNKRNFDDNKDAKTKQIESAVTVGILKKEKDKCKRLIDSLDKRLSSLYIIASDAILLLQVGGIMKDIYEYQAESFQIVLRNPQSSFLYYNNQQKIIDNAQSVFNLIYMVILSYGDISKMKVADRKIVYTQITMQLRYLQAKCAALNSLLKMIEYSDLYKKSKGYQYIDMDKAKVDEILKDWKH